jgi:hypothetical protein
MNTRKALEKTKAKQIKKEIKDQKKKKEWWIIKTKKYRIPLYFLPLAIFLIPIYEIRDLCKNKIRRDFTDENCKKVLDKVVPKMLKWSEKDELYYDYFRIGCSPNFEKYAPLYLKTLVKLNRYKLRQYLMEEYEMEGFTKNLEVDYDWHYITFKEKI